ncbi:Fur family transcriptional regulator [Paenibacillus beijingensis]|uniref:Fur family transcriptional regulator n=1 Tax=Paenibacillus beijingensis TaxID=1126833 RepID=A0A0D5NIW4_9BACL|nr:Fur family transcriptional regulator [Paenibacillus beijingensis]AJY75196.1 Fur family transcriptional regulator [Paenibacillus beijingensis]
MEHRDLDTAMKKLEEQHIRLTPQRYAVIEYLYASHSHPTAEDIYQSLALKYPSLSVATVYNNLKVFKKLGLVKELTMGDSSRRYEAVTTEHYHVICNECGKVVDVDLLEPLAFKAQIERETGFVIDIHNVDMHGTCPQCLKIN